jgi:hypothetical protein
VLWAILALLRERRYIGDWINVAFAVPLQPGWILDPGVFWRAPLANLLQYLHWEAILRWVVGTNVLFGWQALLAGYGVLILAGQWMVGRAAFGTRKHAILYISLFASSGLLLFSLGHVENYPVSMALLAWASWLGVRAVRTRKGAIPAFVMFGAAAAAHPQAVIFAPSLAVVWLSCAPNRGRLRFAFFCLVALLAIPVVLLILGAAIGSPPSFRAAAGGDATGVLLPVNQAFSMERFREVAMILARLYPVLPLVAAAVVLWRLRLALSDRVGFWFAVNLPPALCYCLFIWNRQPLETDWDLMSLSLMMIWMAAAYFLIRAAPSRDRIRIVLCVIALQVPHTVLWLGWNATADPAQQPLLENLQREIDARCALSREGFLVPADSAFLHGESHARVTSAIQTEPGLQAVVFGLSPAIGSRQRPHTRVRRRGWTSRGRLRISKS